MSTPLSSIDDDEPIVYTVPQAARLLQCSDNHVYSLCSQDRLPHFRAGKLIRIPRWGLMQYIAEVSGAPLPELAIKRDQSAHVVQPEPEEG
jgi:excisionase family DNA binding protein